MLNLSKGIFAKITGSGLNTAIGGRFYKGRAPEDTDYPYIVYILVSDVPDNTFTETLEDVTIQFSLFSEANSSTEIETIFGYLKALYDDCSLSITGETLLYMMRTNAVLLTEDHTTKSGLRSVWHYAIDYRIKTKVG